MGQRMEYLFRGKYQGGNDGRQSMVVVSLIAAECCTVAAKDLGGHYAVNGTLAKGRNYSVTADIVMTSETTCNITWYDGSKGVCILDGNTLSIGTALRGEGGPQVGAYQVSPDGSIEGVFIDNFHDFP